MKGLLIALLVVGVLGAIVFFIVRGIRRTTATAAAMHDDLMEPYLVLLQAEKYDEAYDTCLSDELRQQISREEFVAAHRDRCQTHGPLQSWRHTTIDHEANLFESETRLGLRYRLTYEKRDIHVLYMSVSGKLPYRIVELLGSEGSESTMKSGVW